MIQNNIPEDVLSSLREHTSSFVLISFDEDGMPVLNVYCPQIKDFLALERLVIEYANQGLPIPDSISDELDGGEDEDDVGGDSWKRGE